MVDDLVDTGNTARAIRQMYPNAKFVTVFAKPAGAELVDDYVIDIPQNTWIEQPWDLGLTFVPPLSKKIIFIQIQNKRAVKIKEVLTALLL